MTALEPLQAPPPSIGSRILFGTLGLIALAIATIITLGAAIAGVISIAIVGAVLARKKKRLTRRGAWFAGVGGTMAVILILVGSTLLVGETTSKPMTAAERAASRARVQEAMPAWLRGLNPNPAQQTAVADSMTEKLLKNKSVVIWAGMMGAVIMSTAVGVIAGSFAWGGFMLLYRGIRGEWLATVSSSATAPTS